MEPSSPRFGAHAVVTRWALGASLSLAALGLVALPTVHPPRTTTLEGTGGDAPRHLAVPPTSSDDAFYEVPQPIETTSTTVDHATSASSTTTSTLRPGDAIDIVDPGPPVTPDPRFLQFALPNKHSYPQFLTTGPDGNIWFAEENSPAIGRITPEGDVTEFPVPGFSTPCDITAGPDGALWFTDGNSTNIGRITTAGDVSSYEVGLLGAYSIVAGPDGALWFGGSPYQADTVGRLATNGDVTLFPVDEGLRDLAVGPDNRIWATSGSDLRRFNLDGSYTAVPLLTDAAIDSIGFGDGGELWVTWTTILSTDGHITRRTPDGHLTTFDLPVWADALVVRPNGDVWFGAGAGNLMGKITPEGEVTTFPIKRVAGLTIGPDGYIWFANDLGSAIGRIRPKDV